MSLADFIETRAYPIAEAAPDRFWFQSAPFPHGERIRCALGEQDTQYIAMEDMQAYDPGLFAGKAVLDIGAADGLYTLAALKAGASHATVIDCDYVDWPLNMVQLMEAWGEEPEIVTADFRTHGYGRGFDVILMMGVIYHLEDPFTAVKRLGALLPPGGVLVIETQMAVGRSDRPVFELASDVFEASAPQGTDYLDHVGVSNYLFPNPAAMQQLALMYGFACETAPGEIYRGRLPARGLYYFRKLADGERWSPLEGQARLPGSAGR